MFLAGLGNLITVPFGWLLAQLYRFTGSYGLAMIIFAVIVQLVLLPITAKSKKSMMKMSRIQPRIQEIQRKYANDQAKQQEAIRQLQTEEGVGMGCGGCLWSFVPMLILIPLFSVIREPLTYMLGASGEVVDGIAKVLGANTKETYWQVAAAQAIFNDPAKFSAVAGISAETLKGIDFGFLGLNLGANPQFNVFAWSAWNWANIGLFLIPIISAASQVLQMKISQKMNNSVITNDKGMADKEAADKSQANQSMKMMMWMMPIMSGWIGFTVPAGLSIYWFVGGVVRTVEDIYLTRYYRKVYDAEDAERMKKYQAQLALEEEKERVRAERRAANPEGITANTSKKKLQQKQREEQQAAKAAAAKEYAAKKGIQIEEESVKETMSGIPDRPWCKGRNYDPNRYGSNSTEE
ncbi:MAG: membrane protein insertase YidC [Oscillospiraceae bacterium]|nr:membrane protein insertase YidC [Oscillospiraceae bacterium]